MTLNRREALTVTAGAAVVAVAGFKGDRAAATPEEVRELVMEFAGGQTPESGKIKLITPEIAENGNTVPISVEVDSAMVEGDMVSSVSIYAEGNPNPTLATFHFTAMSGSATASTRIRLLATQHLVAVAKMADGSTYMDRKEVKVTIGGCGG